MIRVDGARRAGEEGAMTKITPIDWKRIETDPRFRHLNSTKSLFLWGLMAFSVVYYFMLPIGAGWFPDLFKVRLWGPVNFGLVFAWSQFLVAWGIAFVYARRANSHYDVLADELRRHATDGGAA
jgi:uncharacterized membrane protein (DUF485 family)